MHPRRRGGNLGVLLLGMQMMNMGLENIPAVTLALVLGQTAIYLDMLPQYFGSAASVCMSSYLVWHRQDWKRLFFSQFFHADDMHLYFNMGSLLLKGRSLERRFGSPYYFFMVAVFTGLTGVAYVAINVILEERLHDHFYATQCAVGFSGVLFALKVVTTHYTPVGLHYLLGFIPVPSRMIYWAELLLIQMITPNASFTGHLAGILVGLLYIKGPLKPLMDGLIRPASASQFTGGGRSSGYRQRGWYSSTGTSANSGHYPDSSWRGYNQYTGGMSEEQQYRRAMEESRQQSARPPMPQPSAPPGTGLYPDLDDLRQRKANRFQ
ncbi:rhomboid-related protein 4-like [Babylonia areolata]|uniref:rhomboid-related protein 4-like n=1 Tax=Babylonia areolata TaxID=304850 RepID=UPI003FD667C1